MGGEHGQPGSCAAGAGADHLEGDVHVDVLGVRHDAFGLFDDDPARVNSLDEKFAQVTPELIQKTAQEYLRAGNRTVIDLEPKPKDAAEPAKQPGGAQ